MAMQGKEYKAALKMIGLSQAKASAFFGFSPRQSRRIASGTAVLCKPAELLLRVLLRYGITPDMAVDLMTKKLRRGKTKSAADAAPQP